MCVIRTSSEKLCRTHVRRNGRTQRSPRVQPSHTDFVAEVNKLWPVACKVPRWPRRTGTLHYWWPRAHDRVNIVFRLFCDINAVFRRSSESQNCISDEHARVGRARRRSLHRSAIDDNGNPTRRSKKMSIDRLDQVSSACSGVTDPNANRRRDRSAVVNSVENREPLTEFVNVRKCAGRQERIFDNYVRRNKNYRFGLRSFTDRTPRTTVCFPEFRSNIFGYPDRIACRPTPLGLLTETFSGASMRLDTTEMENTVRPLRRVMLKQAVRILDIPLRIDKRLKKKKTKKLLRIAIQISMCI